MDVARHLASFALARSAWQQTKRATSAFFFASGGEDSGDHLAQVVRFDAAAACWFIKSTVGFSIIGGVLVCAACATYLSLHWERCSGCNRPLRLWLVVQCFLQVMQLPVRVVLFSSVRASERAGRSIETCVTSMTSAPAWRMSKVVAVFHYAWFFVGVVWWNNSDTCDACPGITLLLIAVVLFSAARAVVSIIVSQLVFPAHTEEEFQESLVEPATVGQIAALTIVTVKASDLSPPLGATCAVCLSDLEVEEVARKLPCGHYFHKGCIDRWLQRNKRCPLCMHPVDKKFSGHPGPPW